MKTGIQPVNELGLAWPSRHFLRGRKLSGDNRGAQRGAHNRAQKKDNGHQRERFES
jgi:hypothetical protein